MRFLEQDRIAVTSITSATAKAMATAPTTTALVAEVYDGSTGNVVTISATMVGFLVVNDDFVCTFLVGVIIAVVMDGGFNGSVVE